MKKLYDLEFFSIDYCFAKLRLFEIKLK